MNSLLTFKEQFYQHPHLTHLNNAGLAPISLRARETLEYWSRRFFEEGYHTDHDYMLAYQKTRTSLAQLVGCLNEEIAFFTNTSGGINQVAFHLPLKKGDEILMWDQEYSSHLYPWQQTALACRAELKIVKSEADSWATPTEKYLSALTAQTRVVAFSWMQFQTGAMMDFAKVIKEAKSRGIFVFVDAMQGMGILPFELWSLGVDALACGSHKWLVSPVGAGFLAIRKEHIANMKPHNYGAMTFGTCDDPSDFACLPKKDASKYEPGSKQVFEITALGASVDLILQSRVENLYAEALRLKHQLVTICEHWGCEILHPNQETQIEVPILNILPPKNSASTQFSAHLQSHGILHALRGPGIRLAVHAFNSERDLERVDTCLANF